MYYIYDKPYTRVKYTHMSWVASFLVDDPKHEWIVMRKRTRKIIC
jgi:hypothetical protein